MYMKLRGFVRNTARKLKVLFKYTVKIVYTVALVIGTIELIERLI
jgi:hypothetical protein